MFGNDIQKYTHVNPQLHVFVTDFYHHLVNLNSAFYIPNIVDLWGRQKCFLLNLWFIICKRCGNDKNEGRKEKHQTKIQNRISDHNI